MIESLSSASASSATTFLGLFGLFGGLGLCNDGVEVQDFVCVVAREVDDCVLFDRVLSV